MHIVCIFKHRKVFLQTHVVRNPKTNILHTDSDKTFKAKTLIAHRTLQHICKAYKTHRTETNLAKELQLPTHGIQSFNGGRQTPTPKKEKKKETA
jgi:hypothetical protein